jgi:glutaredoxin 3
VSTHSRVVVYSMDYCPYCVAAKNLLRSKGIPFTEVTIDTDDDSEWNKLYERSRMRTLPQIFFGDRLVGGYQELAALNSEDGLTSLK